MFYIDSQCSSKTPGKVYTYVCRLAFESLKPVTHTLRAVNAWATVRLHWLDNNTYFLYYQLTPSYSLSQECVVLSFYACFCVPFMI